VTNEPITVFSDFTCPFSFVTEAALRRRAAETGVKVSHRAFELYPTPTAPVAPANENGWEEAVRPLAAELGLKITAPGFRPRTRKAHEAACFAREHAAEEMMRPTIFEAYWVEERDIGRIDVLMELAERSDLDPVQLKIALDIDRYREGVLRDEALARQLRITGIPTLFLGTGPGAHVLVGAQSYASLYEALSEDG
jgi:predicted DsbA family dithiol-disulfide isomerase